MKYLFLLGCSCLFPAAALAQEARDEPAVATPADGAEASADDAQGDVIIFHHRVRENYITVLGTGLRGRLDNTAQPVTIFGFNEIEAVQGADITRLLERAPGVSITRNGGIGAFTGVRVRGAEAEQLLVVVDGVRVADTASPGGGFDFGTLLPSGIGKVELLRGSNSTIWGGQAIGGVLSVWSHGLDGIDASIEYGARDTLHARASGGVQTGALDLNLNAAYFDTDGFSSAATGTEDDGFTHWQAGGYALVDLSDTLTWRSSLRYAEGDLDIDGFPAPVFAFADTPESQQTRQLSAVTGLQYSGDDLTLLASASLADTERDSFNLAVSPDPSFSTDGESERLELRGDWQASDNLSLRFGGEYEWQRFASTFDAPQTARIGGTYAQIGFDNNDLLINIGARYDDHSEFGGEVSFGGDAAYEIAGDWRIRASIGEGFKAPTLFQLFSDFGNTTLQPERSTSYEVGIQNGDRGGSEYFGVTLFQRDTRDQIDFISCFANTSAICVGRPFGTYDNIAKTRARGVEVEGGMAVTDRLNLGLAYAYVDTENRASGSANFGNELARRPKHALTAVVDFELADQVRVGTDLRLVSDSFDNAANTVSLDDYVVQTFRWEADLNDMITMFGRVENLWNAQYQTVSGYATPGRSAYIGARLRY